MKLFRYGIEVFDGSHKRYGGHSQWIYRLLGKRIDYLHISLCFRKPFYSHYWHDWQHHCICFVFFAISWGGNPILDEPKF